MQSNVDPLLYGCQAKVAAYVKSGFASTHKSLPWSTLRRRPDRSRLAAEADPRWRRDDPGRPGQAHRPGPLDDHPAARAAAAAGPAEGGRRQRVDRRAPADAARLQRGRRPGPGRRPRRHPLAPRDHQPRRPRSWPRTAATSRSPTGPKSVLEWVEQRFEALLAEAGAEPRRGGRDRDRRAGPGRALDRPAAQPADHARLGRLPDPRALRRAASAPRCWSTTTSTSWPWASTGADWREVEHLLFVKVGTGIGCGIVIDGRIHRGADGAAGDLGHVRIAGRRGRARTSICSCGNVNCLEALAGGGAMARRLQRRRRRRPRLARRGRADPRRPARRGPARPPLRPPDRRGPRRRGQLLQPLGDRRSAATSPTPRSSCSPASARSSTSAPSPSPPATCASSAAPSRTAPA